MPENIFRLPPPPCRRLPDPPRGFPGGWTPIFGVVNEDGSITLLRPLPTPRPTDPR